MSDEATAVQAVLDPVVPSADDAELARESSRLLEVLPSQEEAVDLVLRGVAVKVPSLAVRVLLRVLKEVGEGHTVAAVALNRELSTQEAAVLLNVSRPFLVKLLDEKVIPSRKVGTHRRVLAGNVLAYKRRSEGERRSALDQLTAQAQELGMGY